MKLEKEINSQHTKPINPCMDEHTNAMDEEQGSFTRDKSADDYDYQINYTECGVVGYITVISDFKENGKHRNTKTESN